MEFSIVIPAKNEEQNIARCLDSIARVAPPECRHEVIVVDNGSCDNTVAIAREKGATVYLLPELTISALRNHGAFRSSGRIIAFLDADCALSKGWFEAAARYLEAEGVAAFGSPATVPEGGTWVQKAWFNVRGKPGEVTEVEWLESANLLVKREAFLAAGGFDESLATCEDYDLTQRLKRHGKLISDHRVAAVHYREPATVAQFMKKEMWRSKSNYKGILKRRIGRNEIPSLVLPLLYLLFLSLGGLFLLLRLWGIDIYGVHLFLGGLLLLQLVVAAAAFRKNRNRSLATLCQLYLLINLYFLARGVAAVNRD